MDICCICHENFKKGNIFTTSCNHIFHNECISQIRKFKCPMCNQKINLPKDMEKVIKQRIKNDKESLELQQELQLLSSEVEEYLNIYGCVILET